MQRESPKEALIAPGAAGRGDVVWAVVAAVLVSGALGNALVKILRAVVESSLGNPRDLEGLQAAVFGLVTGGICVAIEAAAAWVGGRVARRMTRDVASLPRVARAYALTLVALFVLAVVLAVLLVPFVWRSIGPYEWLMFGAGLSLIVVLPFAGRAGVLGSAPREHRRRARRS
jgi:hypothetical protein